MTPYAKTVYEIVWPEDAPDASHQAMREALCECAVSITHECGTEESTLRACVNTVSEFLDYELMHACAFGRKG